jgi:hypothetical protein
MTESNIIIYNINGEIICSLININYYDLKWYDIIYKIRIILEDKYQNGFNNSIDLILEKYNKNINLLYDNCIIHDIDVNDKSLILRAIIQPLKNNDIDNIIIMLNLYTNCPNKFISLIEPNLKNKIFIEYLINYLIKVSCNQCLINHLDKYLLILKNLGKYFKDYNKFTNSSLILSIESLLLLSNANNPSADATHPV